MRPPRSGRWPANELGAPSRAGPASCAAALAAAAAQGAYRLLRRKPPAGEPAWTRTNHRGEPVTLLEGPAVAAGAALAAVASPGLPGRARAALLAAAAGAAAFGGYDDLAGSGDRRGFRGHLGALAHGELTTGAAKLGGIGATGLAASALLGGGPVDTLLNAGLIAGGANLVNLFDLRPGRASKVTVASGGLLAAAAPGVRAAGRGAGGRRAGAARRGPGRSGPCSATPGRTRSAPCSARPRRRACRGPPGSRCSPASSG